MVVVVPTHGSTRRARSWPDPSWKGANWQGSCRDAKALLRIANNATFHLLPQWQINLTTSNIILLIMILFPCSKLTVCTFLFASFIKRKLEQRGKLCALEKRQSAFALLIPSCIARTHQLCCKASPPSFQKIKRAAAQQESILWP